MSSANEEKDTSLVEKVFHNPRNICQGEYTTIYAFLLSPDICNDPEMIIGVLEEFAGWAQHMLERIQKFNGLD